MKIKTDEDIKYEMDLIFYEGLKDLFPSRKEGPIKLEEEPVYED